MFWKIILGGVASKMVIISNFFGIGEWITRNEKNSTHQGKYGGNMKTFGIIYWSEIGGRALLIFEKSEVIVISIIHV